MNQQKLAALRTHLLRTAHWPSTTPINLAVADARELTGREVTPDLSGNCKLTLGEVRELLAHLPNQS